MTKPETTTIDLDASVAEENKRARRKAMNVVRIPVLRLIGFSFVLLFVLLYNFFITGTVAWSVIAALGTIFAAYCWFSWVALYLWFDRTRDVDLGFVFLALDMVLWTVAIYCCGGENSWLLFFLIIRAADQATTGFRRVLFFAHFSLVCYAGLLAYAALVDGHTLNLPAEGVKMTVLYGAGIYVSLTARAAEEIRDRTRAAMHLARDLIGRLQTKEVELRESEARFRDLFEKAPVGIYRATPDGQILIANPALLRMLGYATLEELAGGNSSNHSPPESSYSRTEFRARLERDGEIRGLESIWTRRDGTNIYVSENTRAVRDERGRVAFYEGTIEDISTRKDAELAMIDAKVAAETAARAKSEFLANMSHEIRTPMNAIIGMTSLLLGTELSDEQRDFVETVRQSGDSLLAVVNDVLDFSKIDAGRLDLERHPFDLLDCVEDCVDLVAAQAAGKGLELVYEVSDDTPHTLVGDVTRLRQILANLLSNAVKFTERGEVVVAVDSRAIGSHSRVIRFAVRDTGIGIPADRIDMLFDSFTQLDASTTRKFGGTGLGLAISKRLAELMGGIMWAESVTGQGSTFSFTIMADAPDMPAPVHLTNARRELVGRRFLVVDDNSSSRRALVALVRRWGAVATAASSPAEAFDCVEHGERFDAVLLDGDIPGVNGLEVVARLRRNANAKDTRFIELAVRGARRTGSLGTAPFDATVSKPVRASSLHGAMMDLLGEARVDRSIPRGQPPAQMGASAPLTVLVVEDNAVNQKVALRMLARLGYRADVAADGTEAVEAVSRQRYDLVFMDIQMPEMDGIAATRWIRANLPSDAQPRIVAMTANAIKGDRESCIAAGMDDYVSKPVRLQELVEALERTTQALATARSGGERTLDLTRLMELKQLDPDGATNVAAEIIAAYLLIVPEAIAEMRRALANRDALALGAAAHRLRGSSGNIGAYRMAELCARVEAAARGGDVDSPTSDLDLIELHMPDLRAAFLAWR